MKKTECGKKWREIPWNDVLKQKCSADKYFMRSGLIRKDLLPVYSSEFMPPTHVVSSVEEFDAVLDKIKEDIIAVRADDLWVLKLSDSSNAYGIHFFHLKETTSVRSLLLDGQTRVLQKYVQPMLIDGKKFHIRALVLAVGHLDVYVYENVRVLLASAPFSTDSLNPFIHITNQSVNKNGNPSYNNENQNVPLSDAFSNDVGTSILHQIHDICRHTFRCLATNRRHFFSLPNCYEIFGFDFLVDINGRVLLLEANPDPSLSMYNGEAILPSSPLDIGVPSTFAQVFSLQKELAFARLKK
ncbi:hypothetical protein AeMF1_000078 [Aphanomyces euteiches]|nr:hypothetical protein AeMF1_000078 [Aphanomyces euteiches]KAH9196202.1 hypothetical protein AeNC1_001807 [Aphanomyces euteiches]